MHAHISPSGALALALVLASSAAFAAEPSPQGWTITLKANGGVSPAWEGSGALSPYLLPGLSVRRAGSPLSFSAPDDSAGFAIFDENWLKAGVVGKLKGPRRSAQHADLRGVHDIDWTVEAGLFAEFWPLEKLRARIEARHGFVGHHGNTV
ncbi:MAG: MipA/OmpV family protein, partial [Hyphomicrobiales bacterium]|nr:MipA/OmpV family protein [Hyphomicrobiales bacterium]